MERADLERGEQQIFDEMKTRFPGGAVQRVALLQYGDDPVIEPGELLVRVFIEPPADAPEDHKTLKAFENAHGPAIKQFRHDLSAELPEARRIEFLSSNETGHGPRLVLATGRPGLETRAHPDGGLTPVMARLGPVDLETLDALITAGIAANRAEAVRWTLARIRERPAYAQLRQRAREIEELKTQF
jgi:hypothetical protein